MQSMKSQQNIHEATCQLNIVQDDISAKGEQSYRQIINSDSEYSDDIEPHISEANKKHTPCSQKKHLA